jgi:uncharacterized protein (DUF983 family)
MAARDTKNLARCAFFGLCPRCGRGKLYDGLLAFAPKCANCGLEFSKFNVGDGAVPFVMLFVGAVVVGTGFFVQRALNLPAWANALIWIPVILALSVGLLRVVKAGLLFQEFRHGAAEGRTTDSE